MMLNNSMLILRHKPVQITTKNTKICSEAK
jgi:hypothetical protein